MNDAVLLDEPGFGDDSLIPEIDIEKIEAEGRHRSHIPESLAHIPLKPDRTVETLEFEPVTFEPMPEAPPEDLPEHMVGAAGFRWRLFPAGGWVYHDKPFRMQRVDQGQDGEIPMGARCIAPGYGKCTHHLNDGPFPGGFGSPYAVVYFPSQKRCRFAGDFWYLGHCNAQVIPAGRWFHTRDVLAQPNHSLSQGWGWFEIGRAPGGAPGPMSEGARQHWRFAPVWEWSR